MSDKKTATARVIFISDGHLTEVETALIDHGDYGFQESYFLNMTSEQIHNEIIGQTFAAGGHMNNVTIKSGDNRILLKKCHETVTNLSKKL